ncbi:MAG: hypothetical protein ACYTBZ_21415 [Planctomycetota bacterium]|jgi:hypothetical protein
MTKINSGSPYNGLLAMKIRVYFIVSMISHNKQVFGVEMGNDWRIRREILDDFEVGHVA